jgi:hypothetical protein
MKTYNHEGREDHEEDIVDHYSLFSFRREFRIQNGEKEEKLCAGVYPDSWIDIGMPLTK